MGQQQHKRFSAEVREGAVRPAREQTSPRAAPAALPAGALTTSAGAARVDVN